ncbi:MAG: glycosyl hydrolase [Fimbriimonas sp.]|nr:glycosyl hydrolase [Fimbriimonas sp.]
MTALDMLIGFSIPIFAPVDTLRQTFVAPPASARPWVYWYFMDGNMTREGIKNDLIAMRKAGIGGAIFLTVDIGIPRGPVVYMSSEWQSMVRYAIGEAAKNGIEIAIGTGPGWCGTGGPWIKPEQAMQDLVCSKLPLTGPRTFHEALPKPQPRTPFFGMGSMTPDLEKQWRAFYRDEVVLAVPDRPGMRPLDGLDEKSFVYRAPYSSQPGVKPFLFPEPKDKATPPAIASKDVIDLTSKVGPDGTLNWHVPAGKWTVLRFGRALTGQTTRPAPAAGLGFETDKFETAGIDYHIAAFLDPIVKQTARTTGKGLTFLHFDSWEMGSQNWSKHFRRLFLQHRGYDPLRYLPVMAGDIVDSVSTSERFLWDLRQTAQELIKANHLGTLATYGHRYGLGLSVEPYDMSPSADLTMGAIADAPQGEFWSKGFGFNSEYSTFEAVSIGHTNGRPIIGAEAFTADDRDAWLQHPGSMKAQTDWALATGINRIIIHRFEHQPVENQYPGMTMGPYGVHWDRTETWWTMVPAYHEYLSRCQEMLRKGLPVADVLYLNPEGAPAVFQPAPGSTIGELPDRRAYNFDACSPEALMSRATVKNGRIVLPDGVSYRLLVLPRVKSMTPALARKIEELAKAGATILGTPPKSSPSLSGGAKSDAQVKAIAARLWSGRIGKGLVLEDRYTVDDPVTVEAARWIWTPEGDPAVSAPPGKRSFTKSFQVNAKRVASARVAFTADNRFDLYMNGALVASGTDFHQVQSADVTRLLKPGRNDMRVDATNDGDTPNPAGLIGALRIKTSDGQTSTIVTDATWSTDLGSAKDLGPWNMGPWGLAGATSGAPAMFASYETTSDILRRVLHVQPDLESGDALRYAHRKIGATDVYFVANRFSSPLSLKASFRVEHGAPEWWDPMTGSTRALPSYTQSHGLTSIPLKLDGLQSGFVVFQPSRSRTGHPGANFPVLKTVATLGGPWQVHFNRRFGGPATADFSRLEDWTHSDDESIRYYSGEATYDKSFDLAFAPSSRPLVLSLGEVENIASVRLNGVELGTTWCAPWRLDIPARALHKGGNRISITVANLWANRLIGDAKLPEAQRVTKTTWSPYGSDSKLQPSGLLGPVEVREAGRG